MTIKRMTANRMFVLSLLDSELADSGNMPPYSASALLAEMESRYRSGSLPKPPNRRQLFRTLRDLWYDGSIVASRVSTTIDALPYWELEYERSESAHANFIRSQCYALYTAVHRAKFGAELFGTVFNKGATPAQVSAWLKQVRMLAQKTHPDKTDGFVAQFHQLAECLVWLRDIPPPQRHQLI